MIIWSVLNKLARTVTQPWKSSKSFSTVLKVMTEAQVTVRQGKVQGAVLKLLDGSSYYSFKGIPYGHVPKRFSAPVPSQPWNGVYEATKHGPQCPQYDMNTRSITDGDENCLFLNVYTKSLKPDAKIPVMVFIHGGAYMSGSGNSEDGFGLGPEFLLQHNVILVTINYRLEVFGFLCLDTPEVPGNAGMKDQVEALRWVKSNIEQFGGDPNNITFFGESAGSASVSFHLQSSMSKGLFNKAILQSGVSINDWAQGKNGKERAFRAAKYLGCNTTDTTELLEFLRSVPSLKLIRLTHKSLTEDEKRRGLPIHFAPVVEKQFDNVEAFSTEEPIDSLVSNKLYNVPIMIGYTSAEGLLILPVHKDLEFQNKNPEYLLPREIAERVTQEKAKEFGERIKKFYFGDAGLTEDNLELRGDMLSDFNFISNIHRFAKFYSKHSPTYMYKFSCDTELNFVKKISGFVDFKGACHADDLFYLFYSQINSHAYEQDPKLKDVVYRVTKLWTNFANTGNPTPDNSLGVTWLPYSPSNQQYLDIDLEFTPGQNAEKARVDFWSKLYREAGLPCEIRSNL